jgi:hypothetical protein
MRLLKLVGISAIFFFLLLTLFTSLIPSEVRVSRAVDIQRNKEQVLPLISDTLNWHKWNRWFQDSSRRIEVKNLAVSDSLISAVWTTDNRGFTSNYALFEIREGTTTVQWYFDIKVKWYPWEKLGSIVYDGQMGPVMEESLGNLKSLVESNP